MSMKRSNVRIPLILLCAGALYAAAAMAANDYSPFPPPGIYDASDSAFERLLTVEKDGRFTLELMQKGKPGNLRSGAGEGRLSDAPGGWRFSEGRCSMMLRRATGGMQMHVEGCASDWGDVPFDGKYVLQGTKNEAPRVSSATTSDKSRTASTAPASAGLPSRRQLNDTWTTLDVDGVAGKSVIVMAKPNDDGKYTGILERYAKAAFVIDKTSDYGTLSAGEMARPPIALVEIALPATGPNQGLEFEVECSHGNADNVVAINITSQVNGTPMTRKRASAWMLNASLQAVEIKPAAKVKCSQQSAEY